MTYLRQISLCASFLSILKDRCCLVNVCCSYFEILRLEMFYTVQIFIMMVYIESGFNFLYSKNTPIKYAVRFMVAQNSNTQNRAWIPIYYLEEKLN